MNIFSNEGQKGAAYFLRDVEQNRVGIPDFRLLSIVSWMQQWLAVQGFHCPVIVLSGLRMQATNRRIEGASQASLHLPDQMGVFRAIDFRMKSIPTRYLAELASRLRAGGVGMYEREFIHLDTGACRYWSGR